MYVWCFKASYINKFSSIRQPINIRHGLPNVTKFVNKRVEYNIDKGLSHQTMTWIQQQEHNSLNTTKEYRNTTKCSRNEVMSGETL